MLLATDQFHCPSQSCVTSVYEDIAMGVEDRQWKGYESLAVVFSLPLIRWICHDTMHSQDNAL